MPNMTLNIKYPLQFDGRGRTASDGDSDHIRDMIEQLLFTSPGERVNQPDLGTGLLQMVFAPNSSSLAAALQLTVQAALQRFLGDLISLQQVQVTTQDSVLTVVVQYILSSTQQGFTQTFTRNA
jgi:phage baseplate assembly protein W